MSPTSAELGVGPKEQKTNAFAIIGAGNLLGRGLIEVTGKDPKLVGKTVFFGGVF